MSLSASCVWNRYKLSYHSSTMPACLLPCSLDSPSETVRPQQILSSVSCLYHGLCVHSHRRVTNIANKSNDSSQCCFECACGLVNWSLRAYISCLALKCSFNSLYLSETTLSTHTEYFLFKVLINYIISPFLFLPLNCPTYASVFLFKSMASFVINCCYIHISVCTPPT